MDDWSRIQQRARAYQHNVFWTFDDVTYLPISIPKPLHASTTSHGKSITVSALSEVILVCGDCFWSGIAAEKIVTGLSFQPVMYWMRVTQTLVEVIPQVLDTQRVHCWRIEAYLFCCTTLWAYQSGPKWTPGLSWRHAFVSFFILLQSLTKQHDPTHALAFHQTLS